MRLPEKQLEWQIGGWTLDVIFCPGILRFSIWWDGNPLSLSISLPFMHLSCEHEGGEYWPWTWTVLRVVVGKQEFRTDFALNYWGIGISMHETNDWSIHLGPVDIECEYDKFYDDDLYTEPAAHLRLFSKARDRFECELRDADDVCEH
jgi:hypothetical protein